MAYILMALMILMMRNMLAILMLFHQDIPNISLFPLMMVDLVDLVTKDGTPGPIRSIFDVYILLLDLCLIARNRRLLYDRMKKSYIYCLYTLSDR